MAQNQNAVENALEIDRLATQLAKDPYSKAFMPLAEEYGKVGMWQEAAGVLEDGLKLYPGFITAMVALGRAYDHMGQATKAKTILEESVKLSPENLRAQRTLIKIYQSQGLKELALQSCAVILRVNPRDGEALSVQSALGRPLNQNKESEQPKPVAPVTRDLSAQTAPAPPSPVELITPAQELRAAMDLSVSTSTEPEIASTGPRVTATELMVAAIRTRDQTKEQLTVPALELDLPATDMVGVTPPSPQAGVVAQLETWLRTIESRRHGRDTTSESNPRIP